jgi:hypothetical protein
MKTLGKLIEVPVREIWKHEQYNFSDWLSKKENISLLDDILGLSLVDVNKEVFVGSYRCDLVAVDETTGTKVIIENQLEASNHEHLGKLITYASGLDAKVIVWIVTEAKEEHSSAIEWLNNHTDKNVNFFLLELHAYKIGDSLPAPQFAVIEQPNDFVKYSKQNSKSGDLSRAESERLAFWSQMNEIVSERGKPFNIRKPTTDHWYNIPVGTSEASISITLVGKENIIGIELYISDNKRLFDMLFEKKEEIEKNAGLIFDWQRLDDKKASRIIYRIQGLNFDDHSNYEQLMNEIIDKAVTIRDTFKKYL